jgi:hypothetical protein
VRRGEVALDHKNRMPGKNGGSHFLAAFAAYFTGISMLD